ncbi:hypothetical protein [Nitratireductor sp. ZSWI3]|uniref:hypothetical protein n=1 Tax=Nitratireductor sp. ZSWI3 TaxID=2966359 RepID=UPI0021504CFC|nr:hypothetical protein [Nitratireductor sp. ZSWI3]MCR4269082.1 hypothetical protein [Nitratireductor sp. ZSWI3]
MFHKIKMAGLSALIGLGTLASIPSAAQADSLYFGFGIGSPSRDYVHGESYRWHRAERPGRHYRSCSPQHALRKAERFGMRRARIVDVNRRVIRVAGRMNHHRARMVFARQPGCPVIR